MKNKIGLWGLLGIPLAVLGVVGSVAFAETNIGTATPQTSSVSVTQGPQVADTDVETNDDASAVGWKTDVADARGASGADIEINDDSAESASSQKGDAQESGENGVSDANEVEGK